MQYFPETYRNRVVVCGKYLSVAWKQYSLALQIVQFDRNEYICFRFRKPTPSFVLNTQFENSQMWQTINNRYVYVNITKRLKNLEGWIRHQPVILQTSEKNSDDWLPFGVTPAWHSH